MSYSIPFPTFTEENNYWKQGIRYIAGVDEVGRGAFAGPVVAAAVILPQNFDTTLPIHDSKLLTARKREELAFIIKKTAVCYEIAEVQVAYINIYGVGKGTQLAFKNAIISLPIQPEFILIDAFYIENLPKEKQKPIIKGDQKSISIAAASIIAKVYRDSLMKSLGTAYQKYEFALHKGYGTKRHRELIKDFGLCDLHRTSFRLEKYV